MISSISIHPTRETPSAKSRDNEFVLAGIVQVGRNHLTLP